MFPVDDDNSDIAIMPFAGYELAGVILIKIFVIRKSPRFMPYNG